MRMQRRRTAWARRTSARVFRPPAAALLDLWVLLRQLLRQFLRQLLRQFLRPLLRQFLHQFLRHH